MTRKVANLVYDLAVAVISIVLFIATPVWVARHQLSSFLAIFLLIGSALGTVVGILAFHHDQEPWPIRIFAPVEMPERKTTWSTLFARLLPFNWTNRAQRA